MTAWALVVAAAPAQAAPNGLDASFGDHGKVTTSFGNGISADGKAVAIQPDGKIVVAGHILRPSDVSESDSGDDFGLARYNRDGTLDNTFGGDGMVTTDFARGTEFAEAVAVQPDGKIVVAGWRGAGGIGGGGTPRDNPPNIDFALARYNADGSLDPTFGGDGMVTTDIPLNRRSWDFAYALGIQADGGIVVAGETFEPPGGAGWDFALVRYEVDGTLDAEFGEDGIVTTDFAGSQDGPRSMAIQADGGIIAAGHADVGSEEESGGADFALARYTPDGALDDTFGGDGTVATDFAGGDAGAASLAVQPDGRIVAAGFRSREDGSDIALARYNVDGTLDSSFGSGGKILDPGASAHAVAIQPDGGIVVAGGSARGFALARYDTDGTLDANDGDDGKTITDFGGLGASATGMATQPNGRIVLAGSTLTVEDPERDAVTEFALARYKPTGSWRVDPPGHREVHPCVNGSSVDLNAVFGVPEQFLCDAAIDAGESWRPLAFWFVGDTHYEVPPGYVPTAETPLEDLVSKLDAVKVVVDGGAKQERTTVFSPAEALRTDVTLDQLVPDAPPFPMGTTLPRVRPLSVGKHTVEVVWVLDAMHCDGLGASIADNCLPAGDVSFGRRSVNVSKPCERVFHT